MQSRHPLLCEVQWAIRLSRGYPLVNAQVESSRATLKLESVVVDTRAKDKVNYMQAYVKCQRCRWFRCQRQLTAKTPMQCTLLVVALQ